MGRSYRGRSSSGRFESGQPCELEPKFRYRVALRTMNGQAPSIVWATGELDYARLLAARINELAADERAWVEAWNRAATAGQSRWARLRPERGND